MKIILYKEQEDQVIISDNNGVFKFTGELASSELAIILNLFQHLIDIRNLSKVTNKEIRKDFEFELYKSITKEYLASKTWK